MPAASAILLGIQIAEAVARGIHSAIEAKIAVETMVAEGRDPTPEEWVALTAVTEQLLASIRES